MRKAVIISGVMILSFGTMMMAQESGTDGRGEFALGVKAGFNRSNVWDEKGQDFRADAKFGFAGGAFFVIPIGTSLGLQPEVLISQKGFKGSGTLLGSTYSFSRTTTYIDIPLQLQVKPAEFLTLVAGPQYSFLMHRKDVYTFGTNSVEQEQEFENDNIRKNTLGFVTGIDFIMSQIVVSGRVGWDLQTNNGDGTSSTPRYKNQWLQLTLGLRL